MHIILYIQLYAYEYRYSGMQYYGLCSRLGADFRTTTAENPPSGTTLSREHLFDDVRSALGSCRRQWQLLISAIYSKRCSRESIEPKVAYLTHSGGRYQFFFCSGRAKNRRPSANGVASHSYTGWRRNSVWKTVFLNEETKSWKCKNIFGICTEIRKT